MKKHSQTNLKIIMLFTLSIWISTSKSTYNHGLDSFADLNGLDAFPLNLSIAYFGKEGEYPFISKEEDLAIAKPK